MKNITSDTVVEWIKEHPFLKKTAIEKAAGMPSNSLHRAVAGTEKIADKHLPALLEVLNKYGFIPLD